MVFCTAYPPSYLRTNLHSLWLIPAHACAVVTDSLQSLRLVYTLFLILSGHTSISHSTYRLQVHNSNSIQHDTTVTVQHTRTVLMRVSAALVITTRS